MGLKLDKEVELGFWVFSIQFIVYCSVVIFLWFVAGKLWEKKKKLNFTVPWNLEEQKTKTEFEFPIPVKSVPLPDENSSPSRTPKKIETEILAIETLGFS